ncbi:MAG TPA: DUF4167 domain-containing protein [Sphingomicrobium sp.]|nr:DUF4167 domain-containing protein [Sphingomicrobium sp.]
MINNRQGGRRRGRGGQGGRNIGGQPGNRQDNRQRGNAAQLLEKYKSMARDSQLAGDRVQTEYYLQFADHYFRVLSESRARFEEQNPRRQRDDDNDDEDGDEEFADSEEAEVSGGDERPRRQERPERQERSDRPNRRNRQPRRDDERASHDDGSDTERTHVNGAETIPFDALPPAIGRDDAEAEAAKPRRPRRTRAARPADGDEEVAPAA